LIRFAEAVRFIAVFYDGVVVPGALILLVSGTWFTIKFYGGWDFLNLPMLFLIIALGVLKPATWGGVFLRIGNRNCRGRTVYYHCASDVPMERVRY